jgi:hypothetical protein
VTPEGSRSVSETAVRCTGEFLTGVRGL